MDVKTTLTAANVVLGLSLFVIQFIYFLGCRDKASWSWIKLFYGFPGLYWAGIYLAIAFTPEAVWRADIFSRYFVRGGITATLFIMLFGAVFRAYHVKKVEGGKWTG